MAFTDAVGGYKIYLVRDRDGNDDIKYLMLHEIGHLLGASHTETGLMSPMMDKQQFACIDYSTIVQVSLYQHLPVDDLNYCQYYDESKVIVK